MNQYDSLKNEAIALRRQGYSYAQIASTLGIAKSTASLWVQNIVLSPSEQQLVEKQQQLTRARAIVAMTKAKKKIRASRDVQIAAKAKDVVDAVYLDGAYGKVLCAVLFWCEGQTSTEGGVKFINSDPRMIRLFLKLLRESFELDESRFRALVHLHDYHDEQKQLIFWSGVTSIPLTQFHKSYRKPHTGKNKRAGYPGCISIRYGDTGLGKQLKMIYSMLGENV